MSVDQVKISKIASTLRKIEKSEDERALIFSGILPAHVLILLVLTSQMAIFFSLFDNGTDDVPILEVMESF